jgi:UDP-N-acetylmuramoyl-L-alanyl-D-glutamate--2,6-diaminopimelate ligase
MFRKFVKALIPAALFRRIEPTGHLLEAMMWQIAMGFPAKGLKVVGVTGTNGKTTTSFMIHTMLHEAGYKVGLMTTVGYGVGDDVKPQMTHMTTASSHVLLRRIKELRALGIEWLVLETTSHALAQSRVWGIPYSVAVMTNLTHEHLAYHGTFERYREAKVKLFKLAARNGRGLKMGIVNADDPSDPYFVAAVPRVLRYSTKRAQADLLATNVVSTAKGNEYDLRVEGRQIHMITPMSGSFNVANSLAAAGVGLAIGLTDQQISSGIAKLRSVEGRMNYIDEGQPFDVLVDYAHSPDSFTKLFEDLKPMVKGRIIAVFGSQGRTGDVGKRAIQGELAGKYCDVVVVTEEDDRGEDGQQIMEQIAEGAEKAGKKRKKDLYLIHNRIEAIQYAVNMAKRGDTVVLLGKGHEKTIERNASGEEPWDEPGEVRAALKARKKSR